VRQNFTRGEFGTPKSRRSSRAVPLAPRLADELEQHYVKTPYRDDMDLVFAHPETGRSSTRRSCASGSNCVRVARAFALFASTTCDIRPGHRWPRPELHYVRCKSGMS
jgi:hypothetical protein